MGFQLRRSGTKYLQTGDVYVTHHSNLAEVHVVFHMVIDDSLRSSQYKYSNYVVLLKNRSCPNSINPIFA